MIPDAPIETKGPEEETKVAKKDSKKETAGSSPAETKDSHGQSRRGQYVQVSWMF